MSDYEFESLDFGEPRKRVLPMFFLIDVSGAMGGERIAAVNAAMGALISELRELKSRSRRNRNLEIHLRAITFGLDGSWWKVGSADRGIPVEQYNRINFSTTDIGAGRPTAGAIDALRACVADDVYQRNLGEKIHTPFMMLISSGESDSETEFYAAVDKLLQTKVGERSVRVSLGIGTENNPRAIDELKYFGEYSNKYGDKRYNYKNSTDGELDLFPKLLVTTTMDVFDNEIFSEKYAGVALDPTERPNRNVAFFDFDADDIL
jgi:uncharacterized protein YegL